MALTKVYTRMMEGTPISVLSYGAKGDGVTDDSAAINAAIADLGYAYLPKPDVAYYIESPIVIDSEQKLFGEEDAFTLYGEDATPQPTIIAKRGNPAIWIQNGWASVSNVTIQFDKSDKTDFTNDQDIGILVRNTASFPPTAASSWVWVPVFLIENVAIARAYTSIKMEAVFRGTISKVNTYYDYNGVTLNKDQSASIGGGAVPKYATTMYYDDIYCRGSTGQVNPPQSGGFGFWASDAKLFQSNGCVLEWYDTCAYMFNTTSGNIRNLSSERCANGVTLAGNLGGGITVENPYFLFSGDSWQTDYAFLVNYGTATFIGGFFSGHSSNTNYFFKSTASGKAKFLMKPGLTNASLTNVTDDLAYFDNGEDADNYQIVNESIVFAKHYTSDQFSSGVAVEITPKSPSRFVGSRRESALIHVSGASTTGLYDAILSVVESTITKVHESNSTGGTVAYSIADGVISVTSTGTSTQIFEDLSVKGQIM